MDDKDCYTHTLESIEFGETGICDGIEAPKTYKSYEEFKGKVEAEEEELSIHVRARIKRAKEMLNDEILLDRLAIEKKVPLGQIKLKLILMCNPHYNDTVEEERAFFDWVFESIQLKETVHM